MTNNKIKNKSSINLDKLEKANWPDQQDNKDQGQIKGGYKILIFINIVLGVFLAINFALGSFAPDVSLLLLCLVLILSYHTKYPFSF